MGRRAKVWEVRDDYRDLLRAVKKKYPTTIGHVLTKRIFLVGFQNKTSGHIAKIRTNKMPWALHMPEYDYALEFWSTRFDGLEVEHQWYTVLHELIHIPQGGHDAGNRFEYRKLVDHDVQDFRSLLSAYGVHMENVKDILKGERALYQEPKGPRRYPRRVKMG